MTITNWKKTDFIWLFVKLIRFSIMMWQVRMLQVERTHRAITTACDTTRHRSKTDVGTTLRKDRPSWRGDVPYSWNRCVAVWGLLLDLSCYFHSLYCYWTIAASMRHTDRFSYSWLIRNIIGFRNERNVKNVIARIRLNERGWKDWEWRRIGDVRLRWNRLGIDTSILASMNSAFIL